MYIPKDYKNNGKVLKYGQDISPENMELLKQGEVFTSDTPDFILAVFIRGCLNAFNTTLKARDKWYHMNSDCLVKPNS